MAGQIQPLTRGPYYRVEMAMCPDTRTFVYKSDQSENLNLGKTDLLTSESNPVTQGTSVDSSPYCVTDVRSDFGLAAVTELRTTTSPGNLWVYDPITKKVFKILGPGWATLPAVTSFILPEQTDGGGDLLILVKQDGLTAGNINAPPVDTVTFTIIDLGQLRPVFATVSGGNTVTLPFVTQITATTSFYAMLGGRVHVSSDRTGIG